MSDLTQLRDHARFMAGREHAAGCPPVRSRPHLARTVEMWCGNEQALWCGNKNAHDSHDWTRQARFVNGHVEWHCHGICGGCMPDSERALWVSIAEEIDAYLGRGDEGQETLL